MSLKGRPNGQIPLEVFAKKGTFSPPKSTRLSCGFDNGYSGSLFLHSGYTRPSKAVAALSHDRWTVEYPLRGGRLVGEYFVNPKASASERLSNEYVSCLYQAASPTQGEERVNDG